MAKKIVKVNEEKIRGYMVGDIPDAQTTPVSPIIL